MKDLDLSEETPEQLHARLMETRRMAWLILREIDARANKMGFKRNYRRKMVVDVQFQAVVADVVKESLASGSNMLTVADLANRLGMALKAGNFRMIGAQLRKLGWVPTRAKKAGKLVRVWVMEEGPLAPVIPPLGMVPADS